MELVGALGVVATEASDGDRRGATFRVAVAWLGHELERACGRHRALRHIPPLRVRLSKATHRICVCSKTAEERGYEEQGTKDAKRREDHRTHGHREIH